MQVFRKGLAILLSLLMLLNVFVSPGTTFATPEIPETPETVEVSETETSVFEDIEYIEAESEFPFSDIEDTWKTLTDEELNSYISNNSISDIAGFYYSLSEEDRDALLAKDTMLTEETVYEDEDGNKEEMLYYELILMQYPEVQTYASSYTATSGYCYYAFYKSSSDYIRYKVDFTISDPSKITTATGSTYTISATVAQSSGTNMKNLVNASFSKNKTTMQRALTKNAAYGTTTTDTDSSGDTIYKTKVNEVFVLNITYTKPAYTYSSVEYQNNVSTQRFNFKTYNWQNSNASSLMNGVYHSDYRHTVTSQVNMRNTGIDTSDNLEGTGHALARLVFEHPVLNLSYSKDYAAASGNSPVSGSMLYDGAQHKLKTVLGDCGFSWTGHYITASEAWKNSGTYWSSNSPGYKADEIVDFTDGAYFTSKSKTLYANWKTSSGTTDPDPEPSDGFTIYYDANGGTGAPSSTTITSTGDISSTTPTRDGYKFIGWSRGASVTSPRISYLSITASDGTSSTTTASSWGKSNYESALGTTIGTSVTLYAQWESTGSSSGTGFTINYDANGGTGAPSSTYIASTGDISSTKPTRDGYTFIGWSAYSWSRNNRISYISITAADGTTTTQTSSSWGKTEYGNALGVTIGSSITLYAQWDQNGTASSTEGFWIFFDANGGEGAPSYARSTSATDIPSTVPTREGYKFMGWGGTSSWCTTRVAYSGGQVAKDGSITRTTGTWNKSQWEANAGMTFYNISSGPDDEYPYAGFLYAQWEEDTSFTINYDANGGTGAPSPTHIEETGNISSTIPTRDGYTFIGWSASADSNINRISYESITASDGTTSTQTSASWDKANYESALGATLGSSFTLYAQWTENPVTSIPVISVKDDKVLEFYEGEEVLKEQLLSNIEANDDINGNISDRVRITKIVYSEGKIVDGVKTTEKETVSWASDMPDDYMLDTWFMQLDKEDSPVTHMVTYAVTNDMGITTELEWPVKVKYNEFPEIKANDLYFTVDEAQEGKITLEEVVKDARAWDKEDCNAHFPDATHDGHNCLESETSCEFTVDKLELLGFDAERFKQFEAAGYEVLNYHAVDQYGKETMRQIVVYIVDDGEIPIADTAKQIRFIDKKQYDKNTGIGLDSLTNEEIEARNKNGGLYVGSLWYVDDSYVNVITSALAGTNKEQEWSFNYSAVGAVKSYLKNNGTEYEQFLNAFSGMKK